PSGPSEASRSRGAMASGRLMRTATSAPPRRTRVAARATSLRALSFSWAGTLSSRSSRMQSAPRVCAFSTYFSTFTGTYKSDRHTGSPGFIPALPWDSRRLRTRCLPRRASRALRDEVADDRVEPVGVPQALRVGRITGIVDQLRPADGAEEALRHLLDRRGQAHPAPVLGPIRIAWRGRGGAVPGARLDFPRE